MTPCPSPIKGCESYSSLPRDFTEEFDLKIVRLENMLSEKDEIIRKQQDLIQDQRDRLERFEEGKDSGHDSEDMEKELNTNENDEENTDTEI